MRRETGTPKILVWKYSKAPCLGADHGTLNKKWIEVFNFRLKAKRWAEMFNIY